MLRGRLYEDDYKPKLSGHETFPLRYGWLKKAFDAVLTAEKCGLDRSVFLAEDAIARFGVGKNMVASIRHWAVSAGVIEESTGRTVPSLLGIRVFDHGGLDPYMEDPATAWLVHWQLCGNPRKTTWFWAFNHYPAASFERGMLVRGLEKIAKDRGWRHASAATIKNDVACFVRNLCFSAPRGAGEPRRYPGIAADRDRSDPSGRKAGWVPIRTGTQTDTRRWGVLLCGDALLV